MWHPQRVSRTALIASMLVLHGCGTSGPPAGECQPACGIDQVCVAGQCETECNVDAQCNSGCCAAGVCVAATQCTVVLPVSATTSEFSITNGVTTLLADGITTAELVVQARDANGTPLEDVPALITKRASDSAQILQASGVTGVNGIYRTTITAPTVGTSIFEASVEGLLIEDLAGTKQIQIKAVGCDATGTCAPDCQQSSMTWVTTPFAGGAQAGQFSASFFATPNQSPTDGVVTLSDGTDPGANGLNYNDNAVLVRFANDGMIDVRNGGTYAAESAVPYARDEQFGFRVDVDFVAQTYDVFVRPLLTGVEVQLAQDYAFRSDWTESPSNGGTSMQLSAWRSRSTEEGPPPPPDDSLVICGFDIAP